MSERVEERFDFIIVGAGAAGCVLANRLSADPAAKVLLIEAGADALPGQEHPAVLDPYPVSLGYAKFSWPDFIAEVGADPGNGKPRFSRQYLQGFGVGGSSNIQGMVAFRGLPEDYDEWREMGAAGWGWQDVLPYFRRLENDLDFAGPLHGRTGPIPVRRTPPHHWPKFSKALADCAHARGLPLIQDFNADFRLGVGPLPMANLPHRRVSVAMGYLTEAVRRRPNLRILAGAHVERIVFRQRTAEGVVARTAGQSQRFAGNQILICAGALLSPAILMRSGVGPAGHLRDHGIDVISDVPAVGQHLMNHVGISVAAHLPRSSTQPREQKGFGQSCVRLSSGVDGAQYDVILAAVNRTAWHPLGQRIGAMAIEVQRTHSRGEVRLRSPDPMKAPLVKFNLFDDRRDFERVQAGLRIALEMLADERMKAARNELFMPNGKIVQTLWQRSTLNWLRASAASLALEAGPLRKTLLGRSRLDERAVLNDPAKLRELVMQFAGPRHHVSCTCRMGAVSDPHTAVDTDCRVKRVENLRVIDASVMPRLVRANTHLPVIMIAEKMADSLRAN